MGSKRLAMTRQARYKLRPRNVNGFVTPGQKYTAVHFNLLSAELRDIVCAHSLIQTDSQTPALLIALRGDRKLYHQALKVFYQVNEVDMKWQGGLGWFAELRGEVKGMVKKVVVTIPPTTLQVSDIHTSLTTLTNLQSLKLRSPTSTHLSTFALSSLLSPPSHGLTFQHLTTLTLSVRLKTDKHPTGWGGVTLAAQQWADEFEARKDVKRFRGEIEGLVGVKGEMSFVGDIFSGVWNAGKGKGVEG